MKKLKNLFFILTMLSSFFVFVGCDSAEDPVDELEDATEEVGDAVEESADELEDAVD